MGDGSLLFLPKPFSSGDVVTQVKLGADKDDGNGRCVVLDLGVPLSKKDARSDEIRLGS